MGWPLPTSTFGGAFIYGMNDTHWSWASSPGSTAHDPTSDPHGNLQRFKTHPLVRALLEGGKPVALRRQGDPRGRLLGDAAAVAPTGCCCAATPAGS